MPCRHVLMFAFEYPPHFSGGLGVHVQELARGLVAAGTAVTVIAFHTDQDSTIDDRGVKVIFRCPPASSQARMQLGGDPSLLRQAFNNHLQAMNDRLGPLVADIMNSQPVDVIHCHEWPLFPAAKQAAQHYGLPLIDSMHLLSEPILRWCGYATNPVTNKLEREAIRQSDAVITVSNAMKTVICAHFGLSPERVHAVYNGLDTNAFRPDILDDQGRKRLRQSLKANDDGLLLFAGRLSRMKGILPLLDAVDLALDQRPGLRLLVCGEASSPAMSSEIDARLQRSARLKQAVRLFGKVPRKQLALLYAAADVAVFPSLFEPFGYVIAEALASGTPVVATRAGGIPEIMGHEQHGLLVPVQNDIQEQRHLDPKQLAAAIHRILSDKDLAGACATAGPPHIGSRFTTQTMVTNTQIVYNHLLEKNLNNNATSDLHSGQKI